MRHYLRPRDGSRRWRELPLFRLPLFCTLLIITVSSFLTHAEVADYNTVPKGSNPTLYTPAVDPVVQLDESTFNDTVFCGGAITKNDSSQPCATSYIVEFYSDWCGHCRAYASVYKAFARDAHAWAPVVRVAAVNCADPFNEALCRENGIVFYPFIKYFSRNNTNPELSFTLQPSEIHSVASLRDHLTKILVQDYALNRYADWPNLELLGEISKFGDLWAGVPPTALSMVIIFEAEVESLSGAQLLLDLSRHTERMVGRRCARTHPLADALDVTDFPSVALFRRDDEKPAVIVELRRLFLNEMEEFFRRVEVEAAMAATSNATNSTTNGAGGGRLTFGSHKNRSSGAAAITAADVVEAECAAEPGSCQQRYYVSEWDMLKAVRYALVREVSRGGAPLYGANLTALRDFIGVLAAHFPYTTVSTSAQELASTESVEDVFEPSKKSFLSASGRARVVFKQMLAFLDAASARDQPISAEVWEAEFSRAEKGQSMPFPTGSEWEHCRGITPQFRGYTCGLWTLFHAVTVSSYRSSLSDDESFKPIPILFAIRDWVTFFFGCEHCRNHFVIMTTRTERIEAKVTRREDVFLYLWEAHNIVNARLRNRATEDPRYPKFQFPAPFLCADCRNPSADGAHFNETRVQRYLVKYYSSIRPIRAADDELRL